MIASSELIIDKTEKIDISISKSPNFCNGVDINSLIINCRTDKVALENLYILLKKDVFATAFSVLSDFQLAEDCVAETFIRLTQVKRFSAESGNGKGFVLKIARNCALELYRRHKREPINEIIQAYGEAEQQVEDSIFVNQILKHLNPKQKQIVILKCYSELTFKEIAKIMHSPESTIKSRYKKAIEILQKKAGVTL